MNAELLARLEEAARAPVLLVASDYDGTLAPIVDDPSQARPDRECIVAMRALAAMAHTHVAVISGRALRDLAALTGAPEEIHLVGSHGSEFDPDFAMRLSPASIELLERVKAEVAQIAASAGGLRVEQKPAGVVLHYRNVDDARAEAAVRAMLEGPARYEGVYTRHGKKVVELSVVATHKGSALAEIRRRTGASVAVFFGDDLTDEDAFAALAGPDIGVKIGPGETRARYRLDDTHEVAQALALLAERRAAWLAGEHAVPIERHTMLSDQRTVALLTPDARVVWMCAPRIDSPAIFSELLGGPAAGHFSVRPADGATSAPPRQEYLGDTFAVRTRLGPLTVTDYLDVSGGRAWQRAGRSDLVRVLEGHGRAIVEFCPRLDFGRVPARLRLAPTGVAIEGWVDPVVLYAPGVAWRIEDAGDHQTAVGEADLDRGPVVLELRYGSGDVGPGVIGEDVRRAQTQQFWSTWAANLRIPPLRPDLLKRSALILRALCHRPTGAIVAAGTTSLPEHMGGVRNWDYRYCWPRDASMAALALAELGSTAEAIALLNWMLGVLDRLESPERIAPIYTVGGGDLGPEAEIAELPGYGGSRPVRVGNAASRQVQLDVFGPIALLIARLMDLGAPLSVEHWRLMEAMALAVVRRWREPDHGIWEIRRPPQHHVHSKAMCWLTLDRAAAMSARFLGRERPDWLELRDEIGREVMERGFHRTIGAFATSYDEDYPDAAALTLGIYGIVAPDDPRFISTVAAVERELREGPIVFRYRYDDGLPGREGGFHLCSAWLAEAYALVGRREDAMRLFEEICDLAGPTGLMSEQWDPADGRSLGNVPQAYSHIGAINVALRLAAS